MEPAKSPRITRKKCESGNFCCAPGCSNSSGKDKVKGVKRSYYCFPCNDKKRMKLWMRAIPREEWQPSRYSKICSDHFIGEKKTNQMNTEGYIPTVFRGADKARGVHEASRRLTKNSSKASLSVTMSSSSLKTKRKRRFCRKLQCISTPTGRPKHLKPSEDSETHLNAVWASTDHDYVKTKEEVNTDTEKDRVINQLKEEVQSLKSELEGCRQKLLSLDTITDKTFHLWTNLPNRHVFNSLCEYLVSRGGDNLKCWRGSRTVLHAYYKEKGFTSKPGPDSKLTFQEKLFLVLVKLKTGFSNCQLEHLFGLSDTLVGQIFTTLVNFLHFELKILFEMPQTDEDQSAPCFKQWPNLKVVVDCTEIQTQKSNNLQARKEFFSNYKQRDTIKFMVGLAPNLCVNYVSKAWGGRASDKVMTMDDEEFLSSLPEGCSLMSDRGFNVSEELKRLGVKLIIPEFKGRNRSQMTKEECRSSENIAKSRIHVERIIQRIRTFHILEKVVSLTMKDIIEQVFTVCSYLVNFQLPIVR